MDDPTNRAVYAWVGEDELGSGKTGIKAGIVPAGVVPLAYMDFDIRKALELRPQMEDQARRYGKKIRLCKFTFAEIVAQTEGGK
jgi:hypothetical protein